MKNNGFAVEGADPYFTIAKQKVVLTPKQEEIYLNNIATLYNEYLGNLVSNGQFIASSAQTQELTVKKMMRTAKKVARARLISGQ